jgi:hypothetical protein
MAQNYYGDQVSRPVAVGVSTRGEFIARTYTHLLGAIALFLAIAAAPFQSGWAPVIAQ